MIFFFFFLKIEGFIFLHQPDQVMHAKHVFPIWFYNEGMGPPL
jgi:hypothetical protein